MATASQPTTQPTALLASDSPVVLIGLRAILKAGGIGLAGVRRDIADLAGEARSRGAGTLLIALAGGLSDDLDAALDCELAAFRTVVLLAPTTLQIHAEAMREYTNNEVLSLTAEPGRILEAMCTPDPRSAVPLTTRTMLNGAGGQLSVREQDVLEQVTLGVTNRVIAETLQLSEHTIKSHLTNIYRKLGVDRRGQAIIAYLETS